MTPFELRTQNELDVEWQRFTNKWLFPWHQTKMEGRSFSVEDFRGGTISYGGIKFGDQQQAVYWQAIERYMKGKTHEVFGKWDAKTKEYPAQQRASSLEGTSVLLGRFNACVMRQAIQTDQALRGRGAPPKDVPAHANFADHISSSEIVSLRNAYRALLVLPQEPPPKEEPKPPTRMEKVFEAINLRPGMFGVTVDLKKIFGWGK